MKKLITILMLMATTVFASVTDTTTKYQYFACDGSTTTFTFTMPCNSSSDIGIEKILLSTGDPTTMTEDTDYTIAPTGSSYINGGVVTIDPALAATYSLTITRDIIGTQETVSGAVNAISIEAMVDKSTRQFQDNRNKINLKTIRIPDSDPATAYAKLTDYVSRRGYWLGFDSSTGAPFVGTPAATGITVSSFMATVNDDATAVLAMATLNGIPVFNVANLVYGALGDGSDDYEAIQAAITAAGVTNGIVWFPTPASKYAVSSALSVPSNVWLMSNYAEIELMASGNDHVIENSDPTGGNSNIRIIGLHIDGNGSNQEGGLYNGIHMDNVTNLKILNCFVEDTDYINISLDNCSSFEISGNRSTTADIHGIAADTACTLGVIEKNEVYSNGHSGIHVLGSSTYVNVINNTVYDNGTTTIHHGIYMLETSNYTVSGNICYDNAGDGILNRECTDGTQVGNNCYSNGRSGISVFIFAISGSKQVVTGNSCRDNTGQGIAMQTEGVLSTEFVAISGNYCGGNTEAGIYLNGTSNSSVTGNVSENNGKEGIRITQSSNENVVANNIVKDCSQFADGAFPGIKIDISSKRNIITSNFIRGDNHVYGIWEVSTADENHIVNNVIIPTTSHPKRYITAGADTIVEDSRIDRTVVFEGGAVTFEGEIVKSNVIYL